MLNLSHLDRSRLIPALAVSLIALSTLVILVIDLRSPIGNAPWLLYFLLALALSRLVSASWLPFATCVWSLAIMGALWWPSDAGIVAAAAWPNRTLGVITLWILTGLLYFDQAVRERQQIANSRQSNAFIESLFEHLPNMVFVKDAKDLRFVHFNKAGEELLGYTRADLIGKNDYDFFPQAEADFFTNKDRETLRSGLLVDIPNEPIQTKTKGVRILHTKKIPIYDKSGTPQYLLGIS